MSKKATIAVVGAGIVGCSCALWLQRKGFSVILIDPGDPGAGTSSGNACTIADYGCVPVNSPTIFKRIPSLLTSPSSAMRDAQAPMLPVALGSGSSGFSASGLRQTRAPSNVLYAVLALVKELDGDQLLAVQSEVGLRLQVLESARH